MKEPLHRFLPSMKLSIKYLFTCNKKKTKAEDTKLLDYIVNT